MNAADYQQYSESETARCPICNDDLTMPVSLYEMQVKHHKRRAGYCGHCGRVFSQKEIIAGMNLSKLAEAKHGC